MTTTTMQPVPQQQAIKKVDVLKNVLNSPSVMEQFKNALAENSNSFVASVIDLYNSDSSLQKCEPKALVMEALKAAVLKLPINKSLGFSWVIAYNNSVKTDTGWEKKMVPTFQIGYKGYIQLAMRTGQYKFINADKVYEGEIEKVNKLTGEIAFTGNRTSDKVVGYFAYIELANGFSKVLYKTKEEVTAHAKRFSKSYGNKNSAWETDFDSMALKTVISNLLSHYGYLSIEMITAYEADTTGDTPEQTYKDEVADNANTINVDFQEVKDEPEPEQQAESKAEPIENKRPASNLAPNPGF